jgi:hypothetical protein
MPEEQRAQGDSDSKGKGDVAGRAVRAGRSERTQDGGTEEEEIHGTANLTACCRLVVIATSRVDAAAVVAYGANQGEVYTRTWH